MRQSSQLKYLVTNAFSSQNTHCHTMNFPYYLFAYLAFVKSYRNVLILLL